MKVEKEFEHVYMCLQCGLCQFLIIDACGHNLFMTNVIRGICVPIV
jgi:hypothetical protein